MKKKILFIVVLAFLLLGCSDADKAQLGGMGERHVIQLWSGGTKVAEWESTGMIENETKSDGYYFKDAATDKLVRVTGDVVIYRK